MESSATSRGSAPAQLRNAFLELIDAETQGAAACRLTEQLMDCTDVLPYEYCEMLELAPGTTFADAARHVRPTLGCESLSE